MLTFITVPKACDGVFGRIQLNAVRSWLRLRPKPRVILVGIEHGVSSMAHELGVQHVPNVARNEYNTPLLDDVLAQALRMTNQHVICYINTDIMLRQDFMSSVIQTRQVKKHFLMIGQCRDVDVLDEINFGSQQTVEEMFSLAETEGSMRGMSAIDYFVFPRTLYQYIPPMAVGRVYFDNWMVWAARRAGAAVIDATNRVTAIHQRHDYSHVQGGKQMTRQGYEAHRNMQLAGGRRHCFNILDATHRLTEDGIQINNRRHLQLRRRVIRLKDHANYAMWAMLDRTRNIRHAMGLRKAA